MDKSSVEGGMRVQLPEPYAGWRNRLEEVKSVLDGLAQKKLSTSRDSLVFGCVTFARGAIAGVRREYAIDRPRGELLYDLGQADGLIRLASCLLEIDVEGMPARPASESLDPVQIQALCRACSGCIEDMQRVLPIEALLD